MRKMIINKEAGRDPSRYRLVELICRDCQATKVVRHCDIKKRDTCVKCRKVTRLITTRHDKRPNHNVSQGGHALGGLNRYDQVHLYLCSDSDGALSIGIGNRASGLRAGVVSRHRWTLPDGTIPLTILDMHGRAPAGEFLAVAAQIDALITLLKGE